MSYYEFQPGDGTRYCIHTVQDVHGGLLVIASQSTWRYYAGDYLKFLHGRENEWTRTAIFNYLEALQ
jgi:hypothetical protein